MQHRISKRRVDAVIRITTRSQGWREVKADSEAASINTGFPRVERGVEESGVLPVLPWKEARVGCALVSSYGFMREVRSPGGEVVCVVVELWGEDYADGGESVEPWLEEGLGSCAMGMLGAKKGAISKIGTGEGTTLK